MSVADEVTVPRMGAGAVLAVARRPALWGTAVVELFALAPTGWWRRKPHLPLPDAAYLRFRMETMYGRADAEPEPGDVVTYLEWCRSMRRLAR